MPRAPRRPAARLAPALAAALLVLGACAEPGPTAPAASAGAPALAVSGASAAAPGVYTFSDCVGPDGTPESFHAVKTQLPAAAVLPVAQASAFRLTGGGGVFVVLDFGELGFRAPGTHRSGLTPVTCAASTSRGTLHYSGFLTRAP